MRSWRFSAFSNASYWKLSLQTYKTFPEIECTHSLTWPWYCVTGPTCFTYPKDDTSFVVSDFFGGTLYGTIRTPFVWHSGKLSPFFVCVTFSTPFVSQRFLFAREHTNRFLLSLLVVGITVVYETVFPLFSWPNFIDIFLAVPIWFVVSWSVERLQAWVIATSFSEFRGMRHS